ncbi:hypothetical protein Bca101_047425 [Brassica carinata]
MGQWIWEVETNERDGGSKATRNPHVVSFCPKARNPHVVSDCQPSNPPSPEPAGTNTHYPRIRHQRRVNFKLGEGVKRSVVTGGIELGSVSIVSIFITNQPTKRTLKKTKDGQTLLPLHFRGHDSDVTSSIPSSDHKTRTHQTILHHSRHRNHRKNSTKPLLDLGTNLTWLNCHQLQSLTSLHTVACDSDSCEVTPGNGCNENSCLYKQPNPLGSQNITSRVVQDAASFSTTDGGNFLSQVSLRIFTFSCAYNLQGDYLISVQYIYVDGTPLTLNPNLLLGGVAAKLSTMVPYTVLHTDIYNALAQSFTLKAEDMTGPNVPKIEFGLPGKTGEVTWGFYGANTVVKVSEMVMCLAFYDGGKNLNDWIVIGTHQLQEYLLEFDLSTSTFSFSDSLLLHYTNCSTSPS